MGSSLEQYRSSIGLFNLCRVSRSCHKGTDIGRKNAIATAIVLSLLLLIAGVEPNPGPGPVDCICRYCNHVSESPAAYAKHIRVHSRSRKNFMIPCCYENCFSQTSTVKSFLTHVSRSHLQNSRIPSSPLPSEISETSPIKCSVKDCGKDLPTREVFLCHLVQHLKEGVKVLCPYPGCSRKKEMDQVQSLRTHVSRFHPEEQFLAEPSTSYNSNQLVDLELEEPLPIPFIPDFSNVDLSIDSDDDHDYPSDPYPESVIKDELGRFYLKLEGVYLLPTSTVQAISEDIKLFTELIHHSLKKALTEELKKCPMEDDLRKQVLRNTFKCDPVYNVHHKNEDVEQLSTHHLRQKYWRVHFPFVEPQQIFLGVGETGKKKYSHYISIRESLSVLLRDPRVKDLVIKSFSRVSNSTVLSDFTDGSAFQEHIQQHHNGKCLQIILFQDAFEFSPLGASKGAFKPIGFYYTLGNLPAEYRSKLDLIQLVYMVLEKYFKSTELEELSDEDKWKELLKPLLDELEDLKINGIEIDGQVIPVCLMFSLGDNLGQHQLGSFVRSFTAAFFCRFCCISRNEFHAQPYLLKPLRTPEAYDDAVAQTKRKWNYLRKKFLRQEKKRAERIASRSRAPATTIKMKRLISKNSFKRLCSLNLRGVKYRPSPLNSEVLKFHVCAPALPVCLAHDLYEGIVKIVLAGILKYFIEVKEWFDLLCLNRRIKAFKCKGTDSRDAPTPLKNLDELSGNAVENWNLLRLLPFIIGDLIKDKNDQMWELYLLLKEICELVNAPKITVKQVAYLKVIVKSYLCDIKKMETHLPSCLTPKHHYLNHYADLITIFGPLIRLFTLRYESKHMFFKTVVRNCKSYINITLTLAKKYMARFAYDHSSDIIPPDMIYGSSNVFWNPSAEEKAAFPDDFKFTDFEVLSSLQCKGVDYQKSLCLVLSSSDGIDLNVGCIEKLLLSSTCKASLLLKEANAKNTFNGYYEIQNDSSGTYRLQAVDDLLDYYALPVYEYLGKDCITLKHSIVCME